MAKRASNSRQSISSGISIPASMENITSFEEFLTMANTQESPPPEPTPPPPPTKEQKKSSKYGIQSIIKRNKAAVSSKKDNLNFVELNKQKLAQALIEQREQQQRQERQERQERRPSTWRNLIKGVLDLQRGRIPLLLAVEAGNQSMVRELLSAQTAEQLQVSSIFLMSVRVSTYSLIWIQSDWKTCFYLFNRRQRLKMAIQPCTWPPDDVISIWYAFWWIMVRALICKTVKVKRRFIFVRPKVMR